MSMRIRTITNTWGNQLNRNIGQEPYEPYPQIIRTEAEAMQLSRRLFEAEQVTRQEGDGATEVDLDDFFMQAIQMGPIQLTNITLDRVYTEGSSGSKLRRHKLDSLIRKHGPTKAFEMLPPIILATNDLDKIQDPKSQLDIIDGNTRAMVAHEYGLESLPAYIAKVEPHELRPTIISAKQGAGQHVQTIINNTGSHPS